MVDSDLLAVARGDAPADVVLTGGRVVNVFTAEIERVDVALWGTSIAGLGKGYRASRVHDLDGAYLIPGFIDAHVHIESSLVTPAEFARAVVPRGTTTVVSDPHEIANVHGTEGVRYMLEASEGLPLTVFVMASSCVPATPMSTAGAALEAEDLQAMARHPRVLGLAEVMNFPGAIHGDGAVLAKLEAFAGRPIDGHAPGVRGLALNAYVAAGPGSDHECTRPEEALEKLRRGLFVFLREATNARNLEALLPILRPANLGRVALCTDDRQPPDLLDSGGIDAMLRRILAAGLDPVDALRLATLNPAEYFGLRDRGAIAPGRVADLLVVDDLRSLRVREVWCAGRRVARDGAVVDWPEPEPPRLPSPSMNVSLGPDALVIPAEPRRARVIEVIEDQIVTGARVVEPRTQGGVVVSDPGADVLKIAVVERHRGSGRVGLGLVTGLGLRRGAMAGTVAHDHHNIIAVGVDDDSLRTAVTAVVDAGGGLAVAEGGEVRALLRLPVAGLMSDAPVETVRAGLDEVVQAARRLGSPLHDPFMALSFLGLEVIPTLKITDRGLVDVDAFRLVDLWV
ncbi:MAG: adenine deaminase [Gemmatimonadota bacterium]